MIGETDYSHDEMDDIISYFGEFWHGCDYDPFSQNCNDFTETLCAFLCAKN